MTLPPFQNEPVLELRRAGERKRLALGRAPQLELGLVGERLHGAASSSSSGTPLACSWRKDSFEVFSSRRRTR